MSRQALQWLVCRFPMGAMVGAVACGALYRVFQLAHAAGGVPLFFGCFALAILSVAGSALLPVLTRLGWIDKTVADKVATSKIYIPSDVAPMPTAEVEMQPQSIVTGSGTASGCIDLDIEKGVAEAVRRQLGTQIVFERPPHS